MNKKVLHTVFEAIAAEHEQKIAVEESYNAITYGMLNKRANGIAHLLAGLLQEKEPVIATLLPGSIDLVSSVLGIFKCGGIYLPLDKGFTPLRMQQVFKQSAPSVLITRRELPLPSEAKAPYIMLLERNGSITMLDASCTEFMRISEAELPSSNPDRAVEGEDGNYIIYTSGSTGMGKAILGCHKGLSHFIHWELQEFGIGSECRVSQLSQVTFDASLRDLFVPLCSGGTLYIPDAEIKNNAGKLLKWLEEKAITLVHCVPSIFRLLTRELEPSKDHLPKLRYMLMAGECLYGRDIQNWRRSAGTHVELVNLYGTSETTMAKTFHRIKKIPENEAQVIHVGIPISHTSIGIISQGIACNEGEIGEIYIKTPFWSKGYYKNPALTAEVFVQNPLVTDRVDIVYKTGDMGRYLPGREIEVLGRTDDQVKVNGIRVTLGEVEQAVLKVPGIAEVAVVAHRNGTNDTELICYYRGEITDTDKLRTALKPVLNNQLMPSWFVRMESFPLNLNGKTDKKSLPKPEELLLEELEYEEVIDETERQLEKIWQEVLGRERIGRKVSFFKVGGTSLKAIQVISRIFRELDVSLILAHLFSHPTIAALAKCVQEGPAGRYEPITRVPESEDYELSHAQKRIWIADQLERDRSTYNMPTAFEILGPVEVRVLEQTCHLLVARHETLRTVFIIKDGQPRQKILPANATLVYDDLRGEPGRETLAAKLATAEAGNEFQLDKGPLARFRLIQLEEERFVFLFTLHHIIADGWSLEILFRELVQVYETCLKGFPNPLTPLPVQYKDYAAWQNRQLSGISQNQHRQYWLNQFNTPVAPLRLPFYRQQKKQPANPEDKVVFRISNAISQSLVQMASEEEATVFAALTSAFTVLLHRYTGSETIVLGTPVVNRDHVDLEAQVGHYLNNLALKIQINEKENFRTLLRHVQQVIIKGQEHQVYPFNKLVEDLNLERAPGKHPLFNIVIDMVHFDLVTGSFMQQAPVPVNLDVAPFEFHHLKSKYDIIMTCNYNQSNIDICLEYDLRHYEEKDIRQMAKDFQSLIKNIVTHSGQRLDMLPLIGKPELKTIVPVNRLL